MAEQKPREIKMGRGNRAMGPRPKLDNPGIFGHASNTLHFYTLGYLHRRETAKRVKYLSQFGIVRYTMVESCENPSVKRETSIC